MPHRHTRTHSPFTIDETNVELISLFLASERQHIQTILYLNKLYRQHIRISRRSVWRLLFTYSSHLSHHNKLHKLYCICTLIESSLALPMLLLLLGPTHSATAAGQCGERQFGRFWCASCRHIEWRIVFVMRFLRLDQSLPEHKLVTGLRLDSMVVQRSICNWIEGAHCPHMPSPCPPPAPRVYTKLYLKQLTYCPISTINLLNQIWLKCIACAFLWRGLWLYGFSQQHPMMLLHHRNDWTRRLLARLPIDSQVRRASKITYH